MKHEFPHIPYRPEPVAPEEMVQRVRAFYEQVDRRRSVRAFSDRPVPREAIEYAIRAAGTSPSGAHKQPWRFVVVSDPDTKRQIRAAAEEAEREFYEQRAPQEWLDDLAPLETSWSKPYLERAPYLIIVLREIYGIRPDGTRTKNYYTMESVGIAAGILLTALHAVGLATLTHTPSPMDFLNRILGRPDNERPFLLIPVGYPAEDAMVPDLERKSLDELAIWDPGAASA